MSRSFNLAPAVRGRVPLLIGIVGPSSSGKTFSALRLATGIQRVIPGEIAFIDTESNRGLHYADRFKFSHLPLTAPFGPLDYLAAIEHCVKAGAKTLVIDSMTHEHSGEGGVVDQSERWLDAQCGDNWGKRQAMQMLSWVKPKQQRKKLNNAIVQLGINAVLCYRADEKIKPVKGGEPLKLGWQPETTSKLHYDMIQRFLLTPGCEGVPSLIPETGAEKLLVKNPAQFRDFFESGKPLSEDLGERMARWAVGDAQPPKSAPQLTPAQALLASYGECRDRATFDRLEGERQAMWGRVNEAGRQKLKSASDEAAKRIAEPVQAAPQTSLFPGVDEDAATGLDAIRN